MSEVKFYSMQPVNQQNDYKEMLSLIGSLSNLFADSDCPYLDYRAHENIFCKYFNAENLAREDCSIDAKKGEIGVGLKTWTGRDDQKVAEFGKLKPNYKDLTGLELVKQISEYRNERIKVTMNSHGIKKIVYHIIKRTPSKMIICEAPFETIDIPKIKLLAKGNENNTYFTDGNHTYHFSTSKNTLYMIFNDYIELEAFEVKILDDPYTELRRLSTPILPVSTSPSLTVSSSTLCLPLYSKKDGKKFVPEKSGLNQWNASGRKRDPDEIYIPYNKEDRNRGSFFPDRDTPFDLRLPDGNTISAKVCQSDGKAIMSNPNNKLGHWLLRDVFDVPEKTIITYDDLLIYGVDCVLFTKVSDSEYYINFCKPGTYESLYGIDVE